MHRTQTQTYTGSNGRTNFELQSLYYNGRTILPKRDELHLLYGDLSFHVVIMETWLDDSVLDNELTISSYSLVRCWKRHGDGVFLYIRDDLSYNAMQAYGS